MKSLLTTLFIIWVVWKLVKPALDKYLQGVQSRMEEQIGKAQPPGDIFSSGTPSADSTRSVNKDSWELGEPIPSGEEKGDLEHLFREALERKRRLEGAPDSIEAPPLPLPTRARQAAETVPSTPQRPRASHQQPTPQQVQPRRADPRVQRRGEVRIEKRRVVLPREAVGPKTESRHARGPRPGTALRTRARRRTVPAGLPCIGTLNRNDVRRGIILAEILGPPKALRDIDSHII